MPTTTTQRQYAGQGWQPGMSATEFLQQFLGSRAANGLTGFNLENAIAAMRSGGGPDYRLGQYGLRRVGEHEEGGGSWEVGNDQVDNLGRINIDGQQYAQVGEFLDKVIDPTKVFYDDTYGLLTDPTNIHNPERALDKWAPVVVALGLGGITAAHALGAGALGAGGGAEALGLDALETFTATNPGWQEAIGTALETTTGAIPEVDIPDLLDPLQPTEIPDIQTPSIDGLTPPDGTVSTDGNWQMPNGYQGPDNVPDPTGGGNQFDNWLENYLSDSGSTTELPYGAEEYTNLGIIDGAEAVAGTFEGMEAGSLWDTLRNFGSSALNKLPAISNALKYALPNGGNPSGGRPSLGGLGGGGGGLGGGGGGRAGIGGDAFEAEKLKKILTLSEYLGSLK